MCLKPCPNLNHRRTYSPFRFCLDCGKIVNKKIPIKQCTEESHARRRMDMDKFCVYCGEQMIK